VIEVCVDRPVREDDIRRFGVEQPRHRVDACPGQFGRAVDLSGEDGSRAKQLARALGLGGPDGGRLALRFAGNPPLAARQIDDRHAMPLSGVHRQRAAAAGLRIV